MIPYSQSGVSPLFFGLAQYPEIGLEQLNLDVA
jgi:hypothetical protein